MQKEREKQKQINDNNNNNNLINNNNNSVDTLIQSNVLTEVQSELKKICDGVVNCIQDILLQKQPFLDSIPEENDEEEDDKTNAQDGEFTEILINKTKFEKKKEEIDGATKEPNSEDNNKNSLTSKKDVSKNNNNDNNNNFSNDGSLENISAKQQ